MNVCKLVLAAIFHCKQCKSCGEHRYDFPKHRKTETEREREKRGKKVKKLIRRKSCHIERVLFSVLTHAKNICSHSNNFRIDSNAFIYVSSFLSAYLSSRLVLMAWQWQNNFAAAAAAAVVANRKYAVTHAHLPAE